PGAHPYLSDAPDRVLETDARTLRRGLRRVVGARLRPRAPGRPHRGPGAGRRRERQDRLAGGLPGRGSLRPATLTPACPAARGPCDPGSPRRPGRPAPTRTASRRAPAWRTPASARPSADATPTAAAPPRPPSGSPARNGGAPRRACAGECAAHRCTGSPRGRLLPSFQESPQLRRVRTWVGEAAPRLRVIEQSFGYDRRAGPRLPRPFGKCRCQTVAFTRLFRTTTLQGELPWLSTTARRPLRPPSPRSSGSSARAPSCASAMRPEPPSR